MSRLGPERIGQVLTELFARRGYARVRAESALAEAWREAAGEVLAEQTRPGLARRGILAVQVANSVMLQELSFRKHEILDRLARLAPQEKIVDLRCRVGPIG
jgi:predicted nucleic acid-binding Zn ribbon protein